MDYIKMSTAFKVKTLEGKMITIKGTCHSDSNIPSSIEITEDQIIYRKTSNWSIESLRTIINKCYERCSKFSENQLTRDKVIGILTYIIERF